jgi:hypothetical protein
MATVLMHIQEPIPRPGRFNANLSPGVERVILRAMAKNPEDRYPTVEAMNQAYQAAVRGAPLPEGDSALASASGAGVAVARRPMREGGRRRGWLTWLAVGLGLAVLAGGALALPQLTPLGASVLPPTALPAATAAAPTFAVPTAPVVAAEAPTATPFADPACPGLRLIGFAREGSRVSYKIVNERETAVNIVGLEPSYPADNPLIEMTLGDALLPLPAAGEGTPASLAVSAGENRRLEPGAIRSLTLKFTFVDSQPGLYSLAIIFDDCSLTPSW